MTFLTSILAIKLYAQEIMVPSSIVGSATLTKQEIIPFGVTVDWSLLVGGFVVAIQVLVYVWWPFCMFGAVVV